MVVVAVVVTVVVVVVVLLAMRWAHQRVPTMCHNRQA